MPPFLMKATSQPQFLRHNSSSHEPYLHPKEMSDKKMISSEPLFLWLAR